MASNTIPSSAPLYREVRRRILESLALGEWQPGDRLPNEAQLARRFGVAVSTIRAGVQELSDAGVLIRRQGKGTFVARHDFERQQFRFSNVYGKNSEKLVTRRHITDVKKVVATASMRRLLRLEEPGTNYVNQVCAILCVEDEPVATMELLLPAEKFPNLRKSHLQQTSENLYAVYQREFGVTVVRMEEKVQAHVAASKLAKTLNVKTGHPILTVERIAYTYNEVPVEIRRRLYEGTRHYYRFLHDRLD
jgi:GntR family transcriptional regulator